MPLQKQTVKFIIMAVCNRCIRLKNEWLSAKRIAHLSMLNAHPNSSCSDKEDIVAEDSNHKVETVFNVTGYALMIEKLARLISKSSAILCAILWEYGIFPMQISGFELQSEKKRLDWKKVSFTAIKDCLTTFFK